MKKKQFIYVICIIICISVIGLLNALNSPDIIAEYPDQATVFDIEEFTVNSPAGYLLVGKSTWDEVSDMFPNKKHLGMSTVYHPDNLDCYLTFSKEENILSTIHIKTPSILTYRGACLGNNLEQITDAYGENYAYIANANGSTDDFDILYGDDEHGTIIYQFRGNQVTQIIIQHHPY